MIQVTKVWWDGNKLMAEPIDPATVYKDNEVAQPDSTCSETLRAQGKAYPRTCRKCGKGPCIALANAALDKKADNARDLGLDYEPDYKVTVADDQHPNGVPLEQWGRVAEQGEDHMRQLIEDLISAMEYHVEQTRPIHSTTVALQAAREAIKAMPAPVQEPVAWKWHQAPVKTSWGHQMVVADLAIDKDHTVSIYCERDQKAKVEAMFAKEKNNG
jgi:hypothetical protein